MTLNTQFLFKATIDNVDIASNAILNNQIIIYPTDTLYSFGADATSPKALTALNKIKNRAMPLSILLSNINDIKNYGSINDEIIQKIEPLLPGPYTILLKSKNNSIISNLVQAGSNKIGIRIIDNHFCNALINRIQRPLITTSVNSHGNLPLTEVDKIQNQFKNYPLFYDKKKLISKGSTIIDFTVFPEKIIRNGEGKYLNEIL